MAFSIIIDAKFWDDPGFLTLRAQVGEFKAIGLCVSAWKTAFSYWLDSEKLIPEPVWKIQKLEPLIGVGLAERRDGGIFVVGTDLHVRKYRVKIEKSVKGGHAKAAKNLGQKPNDNAETSLPEAQIRQELGSDQALPSLISSLNLKNNNSESVLGSVKKTWLETLRHFGHDRNLTMGEEQLIYMALQQESAELIDQALFGARFEPKTERFNPALAPDISRILGDKRRRDKPSQVGKFAGYAKLGKKVEWGDARDAVQPG